jgi:hypothetical protein
MKFVGWQCHRWSLFETGKFWAEVLDVSSLELHAGMIFTLNIVAQINGVRPHMAWGRA